MTDNLNTSQFHSVHLHEEDCKGCTICVTGCPAEAIRVRDGKAHIIEEKCIDCGECIRRCPNKAKYANSSELEDLALYARRAALIAPAVYAQFNLHYTTRQIHEAFKSIGFTDVFDVSPDALTVSRATAKLFESGRPLPKPVISSSCPTVIKLIEVRFPALIDNLLPLLPPVEVCARRVRGLLEKQLKSGEKLGIFFISPCPAKITVARNPVGYDKTVLDGAFSFANLYLPLITKLRAIRDEEKQRLAVSQKVPEDGGQPVDTNEDRNSIPDGLSWGRESGEAEHVARYLKHPENFNWITSCGLSQITETLEGIEDGQYSIYDFAEIAACAGGCLGGPLMIKAVSESGAHMRMRLREHLADAEKSCESLEPEQIVLSKDIAPRPARQLSSDFAQARKMMEQLEEIAAKLPGLDCGSCGAPNCRALAEDIVRKQAHLEDCVTIMKARYEELLFGKTPGTDHGNKK